MICNSVNSSPILGSHGSSVVSRSDWIESAVSLNQLPGASAAVGGAGEPGGTSRSSMVLVAHSTSPFDAPKRIPKKTPATIRPQYGFR